LAFPNFGVHLASAASFATNPSVNALSGCAGSVQVTLGVLPALLGGSQQVAITNPYAETISLDAAIAVN
jgi:hypothetical protein